MANGLKNRKPLLKRTKAHARKNPEPEAENVMLDAPEEHVEEENPTPKRKVQKQKNVEPYDEPAMTVRDPRSRRTPAAASRVVTHNYYYGNQQQRGKGAKRQSPLSDSEDDYDDDDDDDYSSSDDDAPIGLPAGIIFG